MKNIAIILPALVDVSPVNAALSLAKELKNNYNVFLVSYAPFEDSSKLLEKKLTELNIKYLSLNEKSWFGFFKAKSRLEKISRSLSFNLCISFIFKADVLLAASNIQANKISSIRDFLLDSVTISHGSLVAWLLYLLQRYSIKKMDKVIVMSQDMYTYILRLGVKKNNVIEAPNFLDEEKVNFSINDSFQIMEPLFNNNYPVLISISSLIKRKKVDWVVERFIGLYNRGHNFNLLIVGDGVCRKSCEKTLNCSNVPSDRYRFLGHISNPLHYLKKSDVFISASESEGMSRSVMEALYLGVPVVVKDIPGNNELIRNSKGGFLFTNDIDFERCLYTALHFSSAVELGEPFRQTAGLKKYKNIIVDALSG